jgi:hypothetical protein
MTEYVQRTVKGDLTKLVGVTLLGLVAGAVLTVMVFKLLAAQDVEDQDRPPIIVRGGSLIFESGDREKNIQGRPWFEDDTNAAEWKQFQPRGKPTTGFHLEFPSGACTAPPNPVNSFVVTYDPDGAGSEPEMSFTVRPRPRGENGQGTDGPAVIGGTLDNSNKRPYPWLRQEGTTDTITRVTWNGQSGDCLNPGLFKAHPK